MLDGLLTPPHAEKKQNKNPHQPLSDGIMLAPVKFALSPFLMGNESLCSYY